MSGGRKPLQGLPGRERLVVAARGTATAARRLSASRRPLPSFLIIGAQKAGTTSLHEYLCEHPQVSSSTAKEVHYFDLHYRRGEGWYRAHFHRPRVEAEITGEASPYYLFHPLVPERVAADLPDVKLIVLLRDPVARAYSHHNHEHALGFERLGFEEALAREAERLAREEERLIVDPRYRSFSYQHHSYLARSCYAPQLERWFGHFDRDRFLIMTAEELFERPQGVVERSQRFLGLEPVPPRDFSPRNARSYSGIPADLEERLRAHFAPHNRRLEELLGRTFEWKNQSAQDVIGI